jgi:hypothetical protein
VQVGANFIQISENVMNTHSEEPYIHQCLLLIEKVLAWGKRDSWNSYDFEKLSEVIEQRTGVRLSVTTLKRICGRLKYDNEPAVTTLNTLALFVGYPDWRTFKQQLHLPAEPTTEVPAITIPPSAEVTVQHRAKPKARRLYYWLPLVITLLLVGYFLIAFRGKNNSITVDPGQFKFKANKIRTEGVPNSVVFHYDAQAARTDSVFVVQTWDMRRKARVLKNQHEHSAIYYYPGFFRTKLLADGQVVKTHDLWITSDGWLALVEEEPVPLYFRKKDYLKKDRIEVDAEVLRAYNLSLHPKAPQIRFFNQRDMGELRNDNFTFETTIRNDFNTGSGACQFVEVLIQCKDDIIIIPLAAKACIGDLSLYFSGHSANSHGTDLSCLGCDLTQWTTLRVETVNKQATIFVNGAKAYSLTFPNDPTGIVGVQYRFNGVGAVKDTWFQSQGVRTDMPPI